jgi:hypothetical protein
MTEQELAAIEALAKAATPGPWEAGDAYNYTAPISAAGVYGMGMELAECQRGVDAAYLAAVHPQQTLALVAEVRRLRVERDAMRTELAKFPTLDGALLVPCKTLAVQP